MTKAGTPDRILWAMELLCDLWKSGGLRAESLSVRALDGRLPAADGKGTIDLLCMKQDVLRWVLTTFLDSRAHTLSDKALIRQHCASIETFRATCGYAYNGAFRKVGMTLMSAAGGSGGGGVRDRGGGPSSWRQRR